MVWDSTERRQGQPGPPGETATGPIGSIHPSTQTLSAQRDTPAPSTPNVSATTPPCHSSSSATSSPKSRSRVSVLYARNEFNVSPLPQPLGPRAARIAGQDAFEGGDGYYALTLPSFLRRVPQQQCREPHLQSCLSCRR